MSDVIPKQIWVVGSNPYYSGCYTYYDMHNEHPRYLKTVTVNGENRELEINYDCNRRNAGWHIGDGLHGYMNPANSNQVPLEGWQVFGFTTDVPTLQYQPPPEKSTTVTNFTIDLQSTDIGQVGKDLNVEFYVNGQGDKPSPANMRLVICENDYWFSCQAHVGSVAPFAGEKVSLTLKAKSTASIMTLPERFEVRLVTKVEGSEEEVKVLHKQDIVLSMSQVYSGLSKISLPDPEGPAKHFNILLMGPPDSGKSSFMLTALTTASASRTVRHGIVKVSNVLDHVTLDITRYPLDDGIPAKVFDIPGYTPAGFKTDALDALIDGELPDEWSPGKALRDFRDAMQELRKTGKQREIHVAVLFVPWNDFNREQLDAAVSKEREELMAHLLHRNVTVVIMLTRADLIDPTISSHPLHLSEMLKDSKKKAEELFRVPVLYTVNYANEPTRSFDMDRLCYKNLETILNFAKGHLEGRKIKQSK
eukprot:m.189925 g.189925  ORF g.189925 m.189925 type:complete len:477 (-) comp17556_c1_seq2:75-1505(-)